MHNVSHFYKYVTAKKITSKNYISVANTRGDVELTNVCVVTDVLALITIHVITNSKINTLVANTI